MLTLGPAMHRRERGVFDHRDGEYLTTEMKLAWWRRQQTPIKLGMTKHGNRYRQFCRDPS
jgi:hypothetical protein